VVLALKGRGTECSSCRREACSQMVVAVFILTRRAGKGSKFFLSSPSHDNMAFPASAPTGNTHRMVGLEPLRPRLATPVLRGWRRAGKPAEEGIQKVKESRFLSRACGIGVTA